MAHSQLNGVPTPHGYNKTLHDDRIPINLFTQNTFSLILITNKFHFSFNNLFAEETEIDDEGIETDSEEIDDEEFLDTKELDHVLEVSVDVHTA